MAPAGTLVESSLVCGIVGFTRTHRNVDQDGGWTHGNKGKKGMRKEARSKAESHWDSGGVPTESAVCADSPWMGCHCQLCHKLGTDASGGWSVRGEDTGSPTSLPSALQTNTRELPWPETFSCLRNTRVRLIEGRKLKEGGGKDPSEGQGGKSLTLLGKGGPAGSPWGSDPHGGETSAGGRQIPREY